MHVQTVCTRRSLILLPPPHVPGNEAIMSMHSYLSVVSLGRWKMLKCGNWGSETEVLKAKYGSEKKSCLLVFSPFLIHGCVCGGLLAKWWPYPYNVGARFWDLGASVAITMHMTTSECGQTKTKTNGEWTNHAGQGLCSWCSRDSDTDGSFVIIFHRESSLMAQLVTKLLPRY